MDILIVGAGEMGRWFADIVGTDDDRIAMTDVDPHTAERTATDVGATTEPLEAHSTHDVVCIAVPLSVAEDSIADHAGRADRAIVDVTGAMTEPIESMRRHHDSNERLSLHPLFAPANAPGNVAVVVDHDGPTVERILNRVAAAGNTIVETTPTEHDRAMETVQAATHAAVLSFGLAAESVPAGLSTPVSAGLADLVDTVTAGNPRVYAEIQARFGGADAVAEAATAIAEADRDTFVELYRDARIDEQ